MYRGLTIKAIIPALNEERAIGKVITGLRNLKNNEDEKIIDEVIVCDNGSTDLTAQVAANAGATIVFQQQAGYGIACLTAMRLLGECDVVLFIDGDDSCYAEQALRLLDGIADGDQIAIGSRTLGKIEKGALTPVQRFGNALSAWLIGILWSYKITDLGPFRAIRFSALQSIDMQDSAFGWTVEMQVKAIQLQLKMNEYPVDSKIRIGHSKISGTIKGSLLAGIGILSTIARLRINQKNIRHSILQDFNN